jgi:HD superfamily phosphohydrolase
VIEEKGLYSIEKYLMARRFMYWQVYLHKTGIAAEAILIKIFERAKTLLKQGESFASNKCFNVFFKS